MNHSRVLRLLVVGYWCIGTLDVGSSLFFGAALPAELQAWAGANSQATDLADWLKRGWMVALLAALIAGSLGIYRLQSWGRWLFAAANVAMFASYPMLSAMVYTWFGGLFADLSMVITGALLLACFTPGFRELFSRGGRAFEV